MQAPVVQSFLTFIPTSLPIVGYIPGRVVGIPCRRKTIHSGRHWHANSAQTLDFRPGTPLLDALLQDELQFSLAHIIRLGSQPSLAPGKAEAALRTRGERGTAAMLGLKALSRSLVEAAGGSFELAQEMVLSEPSLLLEKPDELSSKIGMWKEMDEATMENARQLAVKHPSLLLLPPAAMQNIVFFLGEVGMPADEVNSLIQGRPENLTRSLEEQVRPFVSFFLRNLAIRPEDFRQMLKRQPAILGLSL
ncbi:unnamed protein product, partial [Discosporangium mesarthrocarpum]